MTPQELKEQGAMLEFQQKEMLRNFNQFRINM
jgi:hypothetical protein